MISLGKIGKPNILDVIVYIVIITALWIKFDWAIALFCGAVIATLDEIFWVLCEIYRAITQPRKESK